MSICIIQTGTSNFSGSFIKAHQDLIKGDKVLLQGNPNELIYNGRKIRYFYSRHPFLKKLLKLLPKFLYHKWVTSWEERFEGRHDAFSGFCKEHQVAVVFAEFGQNGAGIVDHTHKLGIPLIVHFHGHDAHRTDFIKPKMKSYQSMFEKAFKIISVSHFMTTALLELGAPMEKIVYNPYGPRNFFFEISPSYGNIILNIGRFTDIKAPTITLNAFKDALSYCTGAHLIMVGTGELLESCKALAKAWKIEQHVTFTGGISHNELIPFFENACMFVQHSVQPSYGDAEGTPNAILEASAASLPVVSTRHAGIQQAIIDGKSGLLIDEYDLDGMSKSIVKLFNNKSLCKEMGGIGRYHIMKSYNIKNHIKVIDDLLLSATNNNQN